MVLLTPVVHRFRMTLDIGAGYRNVVGEPTAPRLQFFPIPGFNRPARRPAADAATSELGRREHRLRSHASPRRAYHCARPAINKVGCLRLTAA